MLRDTQKFQTNAVPKIGENMEQRPAGQKISIVTVMSEREKSGVYLATDELQNLVIYKRLAGEERAETYRRLQALNSSWFPKVTDIWVKDGETFVTEEYVEGKTLDLVLEDEISVRDGFSYARQLLEAIQVLHQMDPPLIHRDVKPENVLITKNHELKLLDFDAARSWTKETKEKDTLLLGTRGYAAPEQFGYSQTDVRSDLYSAGVVCSLIAGKMPLERGMKKRVKVFLDKATMFDPGERFQSAEEMLRELDKLRAGHKNWQVACCVFLVLFACGVWLWTIHDVRSVEPKDGVVQAVMAAEKENGEPGKVTALDLDVLPQEYRYRIIGSRVRRMSEGLLEERVRLENLPVPYDADGAEGFFSENQECAIGVERPLLRYLKAYPQAILFSDYKCEAGSIREVRLERYSASGGKVMERVKLAVDEDCLIKGGLFCLKAEALQRLNPGIYEMTISVRGKNDFTYEYYLQVHGEDEKVDKFAVRAINPIQYYSPTADNDVFFYVYNTPWPIEKVLCNGAEVSGERYLLTADGRGVVLQKVFFENADGSQELTFEMKNGQKAYGRVILIP